MSDSDNPFSPKYAVAFLLLVLIGVVSEIPDFELPSTQDASWTPLIGLLRAVIAGVGFGLIVFIIKAWERKFRDDDRQPNLRYGIYAFLIVGGGDLVIELLMRIFLYGHPTQTEFKLILVQMVRAGGGWLVPLVFLALFSVLMFLKIRRSR